MGVKVKLDICESCIEAVLDEAGGTGFRLNRLEAAFMAQQMGADICDHICQRVEDPDCECDCACQELRGDYE